MSRARLPLNPASLALGFLLWALALTTLYAALSIGCEIGWNRAEWGFFNPLRMILIAIWIGHLAMLAWLYLTFRRQRRKSHAPSSATTRFLGAAALGTTAAAIAATAWTGIAIPVLSLCV